jgi:ABC-type uncharacterized transport system auxiliary subunit
MRRVRALSPAWCAAATAVVVALALGGCGGSVPAARFYVLDYEAAPGADAGGAATGTPARPAPTKAPLVLGIEGFSTSPLYSDRRIAYRASAHEVVYYPNHYWAAAPGDLVAGGLARQIRRAGVVEAVAVAPYGQTPDWLLSGDLATFEEAEVDGRGVARIVLVVRIESVAERRVLREEEIRAERPVARRTPEDVAAAMSAAVQEVGARVITLIGEEAAKR